MKPVESECPREPRIVRHSTIQFFVLFSIQCTFFDKFNSFTTVKYNDHGHWPIKNIVMRRRAIFCVAFARLWQGGGGRLGGRGFNTINSGGGGSGVLGVIKLKRVADIYKERDRVEEWTSGKPGGGCDE